MSTSSLFDESLSDIQPNLDRHVISHLALMQDMLIVRAHNLAARFKEERALLQKAAITVLPAGTRLPAATYASITLCVRHHHGSLELYWKKVTRRSKHAKPIFHDLRRNAAGEYSDFVLSGSAQEWEQPLVLAYEQRARLIRKRWSLVCKCLARARQLKRTADAASAGHPIERFPAFQQRE